MNDLLAAVRSDATLGPYAAELARTARNSIRLRSFVPDEGLPLGASKIGGHPDVPAGFAWPTRRIDMPAERLAVSNDARLLLQLSMKTCDWTGMRFGRDLYFYVRESALREGDLSGAWYDMD
jgi:uncharacterized protein YwqG